MKRADNPIGRVQKHPFLTIVVVLAAIAVFMATCTDIPERIISPEGQPLPPVKNKELLGTWVSEQWPEQKFVFTEEKVQYRELEYSVVLEAAGTYTYEPDGAVEWVITWYSGNFTRWKGKLKGDRITVEFHNSWDDSAGTDTLNRVP